MSAGTNEPSKDASLPSHLLLVNHCHVWSSGGGSGQSGDYGCVCAERVHLRRVGLIKNKTRKILGLNLDLGPLFLFVFLKPFSNL